MGHDFLSAMAELLRQVEQMLRDAQEQRQVRQRQDASQSVGGQPDPQGARRQELARLAQHGESVLARQASLLLAQRWTLARARRAPRK
jgi:hypothetical protein